MAASVLCIGCSSRDERAQQAYASYQAAAAVGDLVAAREALALLVATDETVSDYWIELGRLQIQLGAFPDAYQAFTRAHELDRGNPEVLQALTQLALRGGELEQAEQHARQLELIKPSDPAIKLTDGYVALRRGRIEEAGSLADALLQAAPFDPSAKVLKSRVLLSSGQPDEAIALLREQIRLQPSDAASIRGLMSILERQDRWEQLINPGLRLVELTPQDRRSRLTLVEAALRSGRSELAQRVSMPELQSSDLPGLAELLGLWVRLGKARELAGPARQVAEGTTGKRRALLAGLLVDAGQPAEALKLVQADADRSISAANADAVAVAGAASAKLGAPARARQQLDDVLDLDPGHPRALRARAELGLRTGRADQAVEDAQKLVSVLPADADSRLLLARAYAVGGRANDATRALWNGFHDIPADRTLYQALHRTALRSGNKEAALRLEKEFSDQRDAVLYRDFI